MRSRQLLRGIGLSIAACTAMAFLSACSNESTPSSNSSNSGIFFGPSQPLGNGTVKTYTILDESGNPTEVGLRLTDTALDGLPETATPPDMLMLDFPDQASTTAFDHVMMSWNPQGHDPVVLFAKPHFDFHFDMDDSVRPIRTTRPRPNVCLRRGMCHRITLSRPVRPLLSRQYLAWVYIWSTPAIPVSSPGSYDFQQIIISGVWDGRYTFIEPMITREWLLTKPTLQQQPLKQPQAYQKAGYYPSAYSVWVDEQTNEYVIALTGMTMREAS
jgi:hypothetical protein